MSLKKNEILKRLGWGYRKAITVSRELNWDFPGGSDSKRLCRQCRRPRFHFWVEKIPWRKEWQPTPIFLPGESMGRIAWWATVHGVTKNQALLSDFHFLLNQGVTWDTQVRNCGKFQPLVPVFWSPWAGNVWGLLQTSWFPWPKLLPRAEHLSLAEHKLQLEPWWQENLRDIVYNLQVL